MWLTHFPKRVWNNDGLTANAFADNGAGTMWEAVRPAIAIEKLWVRGVKEI